MTGQQMTVLFFCFCSGCCSLVYQIIWIRLFSLALGSTLLSVSFVTSMFFLGLALGSRLGGSLAERRKDPLTWYGRLEILVPVLAFLVPPVHGLLEGLDSPALVRAGAAFSMLAAAVPMGCVLPVLTPCFTTRSGEGHLLAWMYGVNTLGACAGSLLAGALGLRFLGVAWTHGITVFLNLLLGVGILCFASRANTPETPELPGSVPVPVRLYAAAFLSGLLFMGWEAFVLRSLGLYFRDTSFLYSAVVAVVISASGAGDLVFGAVLRRRRALPVFATCTAAGAVVAVLCAVGMLYRYEDVVRLDMSPLAQLALILLFAGVPVFFFSVSMPAFFTELCRCRRIPVGAGRLFACNTLGAVSGALLFPVLLFPVAGLTMTLGITLGLAAAYLVTACGLWIPALGTVRSTALLGSAVLLVFGAGSVFMPDMVRTALEAKLRGDLGHWAQLARILDIREGLYGDSWIAELPGGERFLFADRVIISRDRSASFRTEGFVPLIAGSRMPESVLSLCFGGGLSTAAAGMLPQVTRFDMVDISRNNVELALEHFRDNVRWKEDPRAVFHIEDAFRFLRHGSRRWDLILAEPTPPWFGYRGAVFYTVDFFRNAAARLTPEGVFSMPLPCGQLTPEQVRSVMKSFAAAFPHCQLWWNGVDPLMVGSLRSLTLSSQPWERLRQTPGFFTELARVSGPASLQVRESFAAALLLTDEDFRAFSQSARIFDLDRPVLEFESIDRPTFRSAVEIFSHLSSAGSVRRCTEPGFLPDGYWAAEFLRRRTRLINTSVRMAGPF